MEIFLLFFNFIVDLCNKFGTAGLVIFSILLNLYLFSKLFGNHLKHMSASILQVDGKITKVQSEVEHVKKEVAGDRKATAKLGERVANIEGQLVERRIHVKTKKQIKRKKA